jgi:manganese transport protein
VKIVDKGMHHVSDMLLITMNNKRRLREYTNSKKANIFDGIIALTCIGLGVYSMIDAINTVLGA